MPPRGATRRAASAGVGGARAYGRARRYARRSGATGAAGEVGSTVLYAIAVGVALTLVYLALSKKGSSAFATLLNGVSRALRMFVGPVDPLNPSGKSATLPAAESEEQALERLDKLPTAPLSGKATQKKNLNPAFGPAPGIGVLP